MNLFLFGAPRIDASLISMLEKNSPDVVLYAIPVMLVLTVVEIICSSAQKKNYYNKKEFLGTLLVGTGTTVVSLVTKASVFYAAACIYNWVPWRMVFSWWTIIPCYIIYDVCSYWSHRISHRCRFFWATHMVHHSGENYNLSVSFRQSWVQNIKVIFFLPIALLGFHPVIFFITNQIAVLFQFWVHTEYIGKLHPWIEYLFATPSNHRVHHGSQEKFIDKNFGATFIFWDRIFKSFQIEDEKIIFGITTPVKNKADALELNFSEYSDMLGDVRKASGLKSKLFYIFASPHKIGLQKKKRLTSI